MDLDKLGPCAFQDPEKVVQSAVFEYLRSKGVENEDLNKVLTKINEKSSRKKNILNESLISNNYVHEVVDFESQVHLYLGSSSNLNIENIVNKEIEEKYKRQLIGYKDKIIEMEIEEKLKRKLKPESLMKRLKNPLERMKNIRIEDYSHKILKNFFRQRTIFSHHNQFDDQEETVEVFHVIFDKNSEYVLTGASDGLVKIFSRESGFLLKTLKGHLLDITILTMSNCNRYIASASRNGHVRIWSFPEGKCLSVLREFEGKEIISLVFNKNLEDENDQCYLVVTAPSVGIYIFKEQDLVKNKGVLNPDQRKFNLTESIKFNGAKVEFYFSEMSKSGLFAAYGSSGYIYIWPRVWEMMTLTTRERTTIKAFPGLKMLNKRSTIALDWSDNSKFLANYTESQVMIVELKEEGPRSFTTKAVGNFSANLSIHHRRRVQKSSIAAINDQYFAINFNLRSNSQVDDTILLTHLYIFDLNLKKIVHLIKSDNTQVIMDTNVNGICFHPKFHSILATSDQEGQVVLWDCTLGLALRVFSERGVHLKQPLVNAQVWDCNFSKCGKYLGVSTSFGSFSIYGYGATMQGLPVDQFFERDDDRVFLDPDTFAVMDAEGRKIENIRPGDKGYGVSGLGHRCNSLLMRQKTLPIVDRKEADMKLSPWKFKRKPSNASTQQPELISIHSHSYKAKMNTQEGMTKERQFQWLDEQDWENMAVLAPFKNHDLVNTQEEITHLRYFKLNKKTQIEKVKKQFRAKIDGIEDNEIQENYFNFDNSDNSRHDNNQNERRVPTYHNVNYDEYLEEEPSSEEFDEGEELDEEDLSSHNSSEEADDMDFMVESSERVIRRSRRIRNRRSQNLRNGRRESRRGIRTRRIAMNENTMLRRRTRREVFSSDNDSESEYDSTMKRLKVQETEEIQGDFPCSRCMNLGARISCEGEECNKMFHQECSQLRGKRYNRRFMCVECLNSKYSENTDKEVEINEDDLDVTWIFDDYEDIDMISPQVGDEFYFISRAYEKFVVKFNDILKFSESDSIWITDQISEYSPHQLENGVKCKVISIDYEWPRVRNKQILKNMGNYLTILANLTLEFLPDNLSDENQKDRIFTLKYFPQTATDIFLVNSNKYEKKLEEYNKVNLYSQVEYIDEEGNKSTYHIESKMVNSDENYFKCIQAKMMSEDIGVTTRGRGNNDEADSEFFSFWEVDYPVIGLKDIKRKKGEKEENFVSVYPQTEKVREILLNVMKKFIEKNQELFHIFIKPVDTKVYTDYLKIVGIQMNLERICKKIKVKCYRNKEAIIADIDLIQKNCFKYNDVNSEISTQSDILAKIFKILLDDITFPEIENIEKSEEKILDDNTSVIKEDVNQLEKIEEITNSIISKISNNDQIRHYLDNIEQFRTQISPKERIKLDLEFDSPQAPTKKRRASVEESEQRVYNTRRREKKVERERSRNRDKEYQDYYSINYKNRRRTRTPGIYGRQQFFNDEESEEKSESHKNSNTIRLRKRKKKRNFDIDEDDDEEEIVEVTEEEQLMYRKTPELQKRSRKERMERRRKNSRNTGRNRRKRNKSFEDDDSFVVKGESDSFIVDDDEEEEEESEGSRRIQTRTRTQRLQRRNRRGRTRW